MKSSASQRPAFVTGQRPPISIIILSWNGLAYTRECIESIRALTTGTEHKIIVVDNASTDGTREWLRQQTDLLVIENETNEGYVRGNNRGLREVPPDHDVLLLNNDTRIVQADWLARLRDTANDHPDYGVVGCKLVNGDGMLLHVGTIMARDTWRGWQVGSCEDPVGQYVGTREVQGIVGACMYIRRDARAVLRGLDEIFVSYYEDTDLCFRALDAGFRIACVADVTVIHHEHVSTTINKVSFSDIYEKSRTTFIERWKTKIESSYRLPLVWQSLFNLPSGYARSSRELCIALDRAGIDVHAAFLYGTELQEEPTGDPRMDQLRNRTKSRKLPQVVYGQGDVFYKNSGSYRVGYTMLETTGVPREWVEQANEMDEVWVPSNFNLATFRNSGVTRPIHVMPLGVDPDHFHPGLTATRFSSRYTFLSVFEWGERKAPEILLRAFARAFTPKDDVALVVKFFDNCGTNLGTFMRGLNLPAHTPPIVLLDSRAIAHHQLGSFLRSADCFVTTTRGEGWGMPILEAMACGLPVIATDWSAQTDFMNAQNAYPIRVKRLIPAVARCPYYTGFDWADPDEDHLIERLRHVFKNQDEARRTGARAATDAAANWTWERAAQKIITRLEAIGTPPCP